jgi:hypothetical protein
METEGKEKDCWLVKRGCLRDNPFVSSFRDSKLKLVSSSLYDSSFVVNFSSSPYSVHHLLIPPASTTALLLLIPPVSRASWYHAAARGPRPFELWQWNITVSNLPSKEAYDQYCLRERRERGRGDVLGEDGNERREGLVE